MLISKPMQRLERLNTKECLWPYILKILSEKPSHAYTLRKKIKKQFGFMPGTMTAYSTLYSLFLNGFVSKEIQGRRKIYKITQKGKRELKKAREFYKKIYNKLK